MLQLWETSSLENFLSHFNRKTSFMVRMDNLSAANVTSGFFPEALTFLLQQFAVLYL
jgi:hypothetical protein